MLVFFDSDLSVQIGESMYRIAVQAPLTYLLGPSLVVRYSLLGCGLSMAFPVSSLMSLLPEGKYYISIH